MLYQLAYESKNIDFYKQIHLEELLRRAQEKNHRLGVTGLLIYRRRTFLQVIEGEQDVVLRLFETIRQDSRHTNVTQLIWRPIERRIFGQWAMAFANTEGHDLSHLDGYMHWMDLLGLTLLQRNPEFLWDTIRAFALPQNR